MEEDFNISICVKEQIKEVRSLIDGLTFEGALSVMRSNKDTFVLRVDNDPINPFFDFNYKNITLSIYKEDNGEGCYLGKWVEVYDEYGITCGYFSTDEVDAGKD